MSDLEAASKAALDALRRERDAREQSEHCSCWQNGNARCACGDDSDGVGEDACCSHGGSPCQQPQAHDGRRTVSVEIDVLTAKAISIVLEGLDAISEKLREVNVGEYHVDDGLRLSMIASLPLYEFRRSDGDYFVAVPLTDSVLPDERENRT